MGQTAATEEQVTAALFQQDALETPKGPQEKTLESVSLAVTEVWRAKLVQLYKHFNLGKIDTVDFLLSKYKGAGAATIR